MNWKLSGLVLFPKCFYNRPIPFRQLFDTTSRTYTYLIASEPGREALLIDCVLEQLPLYIQLFEELKLVLTLETHTHADHITAAGSFQDKFQSQIAVGETTQAESVNLKIKEGKKIAISGIKLEVLYTPEHTNDSYSYLS
ncbi:MBL fold metallo-hydrolase [Coxiella-like endosymbiont of Rhipicephalus sanguineus]|uniref:MBL fold metallo-hydrolase n=1 Tax=Coxiella-like endosymbiont of Rhipicephalus sanguineus TaxID=1955402 RepID=UPI00203AD376|nr:MBL fold metallo-hydrolase [Coxiella-like endosymbiont of Rhipicephalus sanguineus]